MFINFSHGGVTKGSDYYYGHSDTAINMFKLVEVQISIWYHYVTNVYSIPLWYNNVIILSQK